jgi:homoserine kinase type II
MAVFTPVDLEEARALARQLGVGEVQSLTGIGAGIENTNYFVDTDQGRWVLTLFERLRSDQLPFYLRLMQHLARAGLPVPEPRANAQGHLVHLVAGKPAALVNGLAGRHPHAPGLNHVAQLGRMLGQMHLAVRDFALQQPNLRGLPWCETMAPQLMPHLTEAQRQLLAVELPFQQTVAASAAYQGLARGAVHADLFCDNVLFDGPPGQERLSGCLDFYFAGVDTFAYDLAVCLNDWCIDADTGRLDTDRAAMLVAHYERIRPLPAAEARLMPAMLRAAALRFWLSRLGDWHLPREADLLAPKDPQHFERVLRERIATPWHPPR